MNRHHNVDVLIPRGVDPLKYLQDLADKGPITVGRIWVGREPADGERVASEYWDGHRWVELGENE